jgi:hypothetical protein
MESENYDFLQSKPIQSFPDYNNLLYFNISFRLPWRRYANEGALVLAECKELQ